MKGRHRSLSPFILAVVLIGIVAYRIPAVQDRFAWRLEEWRARIKYTFNPPEELIFIPKQQEQTIYLEPVTDKTQLFNPSPTIESTSTPEMTIPIATKTLAPTHTPTQAPTVVQLQGYRHEYQGWNNCGPATLAIALSYWGWEGSQYDIASVIKPYDRDKNVMPYELATYVETQTGYQVASFAGGDLDLIRQFVANGYPVIIEKGFEGAAFDGWMGHYVLVTGYDDASRTVTLQDSYIGPDQTMIYESLESYWRTFNFTYIVVYPHDREPEIMNILNTRQDRDSSMKLAAQIASVEIITLTGRDQFFAWFNRGTSLVALQDYIGAAAAYDQAFALYAFIPENERPWRMMWYQTGPYWAYFYSGRYQDVFDLATKTLDNMSEPILEESYFWRGLAREALGDAIGATADLQNSLKYHPGFEPALEQLKQLGVGD
jgi:tetratricopeptide (TPR) repeat protein